MSTVVFFGAHADDIEIGAGGTCAKIAAAGYDVHIVVATDEADAAVADRRRSEAISAAKALGVPSNRVHFLGHPDGDLRCTRSAVGRLRTFLNQEGIRPVAVFTHTDFDSHNDHVELTKIVRGALRQIAIFKYIVRNSAVVSHFSPNLYSRVDHMLGAKSRALVQHASQVAAGRISIDKVLGFAERFGVAESGQHLEAFDVEMQDGATGVSDLIDIVNDAPFSRFWSPVYHAGDLTILAGDGTRTLAPGLSAGAAVSGAPGTLQLVTQLQAMLLATFATDTQRNLRTFVRVAPRNAALTSDVKTGSALILGSAAVNRAAAEALGRLPSLRFRMDFASAEHAGHPVIDTATGRIIKPLWAASRKRGSRTAQAPELSRDFGLLTIARLPGTGDAKPMITINAAGIGPAGLAGAFQCLSNPEALGHIVDVALLVMSGREAVAQWLVPATANGDPVTSELVCSIAPNGRAVTQDNSRLKRESGKAPARTAAAARRRVA